MTESVARTWVRRGAVWASLVAVLDLVIWLARSNAWTFASVAFGDFALTAVCALGLWRRSRTAATVLVAYWAYSKVWQLIVLDRVVGPVIGFVVLGWVFLNAARAAFALHRLGGVPREETAQAS